MAYINGIDTAAVLSSIFESVKRQTEVNATNLAGASAENNHIRQDVLVTQKNLGGFFAGVHVSKIYEAIDQTMIDSLRKEGAVIGKLQAMDSYHSKIKDLFGTRGTAQTFVNKLEDMLERMRTVATNPTNPGVLLSLANAVDMHAKSVVSVAMGVQNLRNEINAEMGGKIARANELIQSITELNKEISKSQARFGDDSNIFSYLKQQRDQVQELTGLIGGSATLEDNQIRFITDNGELVIDGNRHATLNFTPATNLIAGQNLNPIRLVGFDQDITLNASLMKKGAHGYISGLVKMGDGTLPAFQEQLDQYAVTLAHGLNHIHNQGISSNPPPELLGTIGIPGVDGPLNGTEVISGSGTLRVGVLNPSTGTLEGYVDVVLGDNMTVSDLIQTLNAGGHGFTAALTTEGRLKITSTNPNHGVVIGSGDPASLPRLCSGNTFDEANAYGASHFFGLNNFLAIRPVMGANNTGAAQTLAIRYDIYKANGNSISISPLSSSTPPAQPAFSAHNISTIQDLAKQIDTTMFYFGATGVSAATTKTIKDFARSIIEVQVKLASDNEDNLKPAERSFQELSGNASSVMGADPKKIMLDNLRLSTLQSIVVRALNLLFEMQNKIQEIR
jgi:flagellar hook-associated protein FlgK